MDTHRLVGIYLNNHLTGATAGVDLFGRAARSQRGTAVGPELSALAGEVRQDRDRLVDLMDRLDVAVNVPMTLVGKVGERVARLKPNGYVVRRSPLSDVVELEGLRDAVAAKTAGWQVLRAVADHDERIGADEIDALIERAQAQAGQLERLHLQVTEQVLAGVRAS